MPGRSNVYFETLEGGARHAVIELRRHRSPPSGKPERVHPRDYLPYHLDKDAKPSKINVHSHME